MQIWLHHRDWVCRKEKYTFSLSAFVQKSFLKAVLPAWRSCGRPEETLDTQVTLEAHSGSLLPGNPEREFSFQASSVLSPGGRRSLTELQEVSATGLFCLHSLFGWSPPVVGLVVSSVSHSHIHLQSSPLFQVPDSAFLTSPNALYVNWTYIYFLNHVPPAAVFPFQVDGHSVFQLFRSNTSVSAWFLSLTHSF